MKEYLVEVEDNAGARWYFRASADNADHAEEQALDEPTVERNVAVFERIR